jgi:hypothetical protein
VSSKIFVEEIGIFPGLPLPVQVARTSIHSKLGSPR